MSIYLLSLGFKVHKRREEEINKQCLLQINHVCGPVKDFMDYNTRLTSNPGIVMCIIVVVVFQGKIQGLKA